MISFLTPELKSTLKGGRMEEDVDVDNVVNVEPDPDLRLPLPLVVWVYVMVYEEVDPLPTWLELLF